MMIIPVGCKFEGYLYGRPIFSWKDDPHERTPEDDDLGQLCARLLDENRKLTNEVHRLREWQSLALGFVADENLMGLVKLLANWYEMQRLEKGGTP